MRSQIKKENETPQKCLEGNGYPNKPRTVDDQEKDRDDDKDKSIATAIILYSKGLSKRSVRWYKIRTAFRSSLSLG